MRWVVPVVAVAVMQGPAAADSVGDMCRDSGRPPDICRCAAARLLDEVGRDRYGLYEAVGAAYRANKARGMGMGDAWNAAVKLEAERRGKGYIDTLNRTNKLGQAHSKAIKGCAG